MRVAGQLLFVGVTGVLVWKILGALLFPVLGMFMGLVGLVLKVALVLLLGYFVLRILRGKKEKAA